MKTWQTFVEKHDSKLYDVKSQITQIPQIPKIPQNLK